MRDARAVARAAALLAVAASVACGGSWTSDLDTVTVPMGTELVVRLDQSLSTTSHRPGEQFSGRVAGAVSVYGAPAIPAGSRVRGRITGVRPAESDGGGGDVLRLEFTSVEVRGLQRELHASVVSADAELRSPDGTGRSSTEGGGAGAVGSELGRVIGGDGAGGGTPGTGVVLAADGRRAVLPQGSLLRLRLTEPVEVPRQPAEELSLE